MTVLNCPTGTITPYVPSSEMPWDKKRALHLYRRIGFGANAQAIEAALHQNPTDIIDQLIDEALALPVTAPPEWAYWNQNDYSDFDAEIAEQYVEWIIQWTGNMINHSFREKLVLFWSNHFVTKFDAYVCGSYLYEYHTLLQEHALGNVKDFIYKIGKSSAMLVFLNGVQNTRIEPNENYARELYELFMLGQGNGYTQTDIVETARALTGFQNIQTYCDPIGFLQLTHDPGQKTIFGQTGAWGYDEVHDILFDQRPNEIATHICTKIYKYFVSPEVDEAIVEELATTLKTNDFELTPVFRQLFKSEHFFSDAIMGIKVKSPIELFLTFIKETNFPTSPTVLEGVVFLSNQLGQLLLSPTDVAGWPGNRSWMSASRLTGRWQGLDFLVLGLYENAPNVLVEFAKDIVGEETNDPALIVDLIVDHCLTNGLQSSGEYDQLTTTFKWEVPQNYYDSGSWNLDWETVSIQVALLLSKLVRAPEYQLT